MHSMRTETVQMGNAISLNLAEGTNGEYTIHNLMRLVTHMS